MFSFIDNYGSCLFEWAVQFRISTARSRERQWCEIKVAPVLSTWEQCWFEILKAILSGKEKFIYIGPIPPELLV